MSEKSHVLIYRAFSYFIGSGKKNAPLSAAADMNLYIKLKGKIKGCLYRKPFLCSGKGT